MFARFALTLTLVFLATTAAASPPAVVDQTLKARLVEALAATGKADRFSAEVWLVDMAGRLARNRYLSHEPERLAILRHVYAEAHRADLDPELVLSVIQVESNFDRFAISRSGARGLMQIMPFWLDELSRPDDNLFDIETNLRFGCTILRYYLDRENGDLTRALARYNGSLGKTWYPDRVFRALRTRWYR